MDSNKNYDIKELYDQLVEITKNQDFVDIPNIMSWLNIPKNIAYEVFRLFDERGNVDELGRVVNPKYCTMCGKPLSMWDLHNFFDIERYIGFGSKYDLNILHLTLCCDCADKVLDFIIPKCKTNPLEEVNIK